MWVKCNYFFCRLIIRCEKKWKIKILGHSFQMFVVKIYIVSISFGMFKVNCTAILLRT